MNKRLEDWFGVTSKKNARMNVAIGTLAGILLGAAGGLLLAPQSGKETRDQISNAAAQGVDKAREKVREAAEYLKEQKEIFAKKIKEGKEDVEDASCGCDEEEAECCDCDEDDAEGCECGDEDAEVEDDAKSADSK